MTVGNQYPADITTTLPPNCKNWNVTYECSGNGRLCPHQSEFQLLSLTGPPSVVSSERDKFHKTKSLEELQPHRDYECIAEVTREEVKRTTDFRVWIDCSTCGSGWVRMRHMTQQTDGCVCVLTELQLKNIKITKTSTSMDLYWDLTSSVCGANLAKFYFTYDCECEKSHSGNTCL